MANPLEMGNTHDALVSNLQKKFRDTGFCSAKVFGTENFTIDHVAKAITTFERTILSGNCSL